MKYTETLCDLQGPFPGKLAENAISCFAVPWLSDVDTPIAPTYALRMR